MASAEEAGFEDVFVSADSASVMRCRRQKVGEIVVTNLLTFSSDCRVVVGKRMQRFVLDLLVALQYFYRFSARFLPDLVLFGLGVVVVAFVVFRTFAHPHVDLELTPCLDEVCGFSCDGGSDCSLRFVDRYMSLVLRAETGGGDDAVRVLTFEEMRMRGSRTCNGTMDVGLADVSRLVFVMNTFVHLPCACSPHVGSDACLVVVRDGADVVAVEHPVFAADDGRLSHIASRSVVCPDVPGRVLVAPAAGELSGVGGVTVSVSRAEAQCVFACVEAMTHGNSHLLYHTCGDVSGAGGTQ